MVVLDVERSTWLGDAAGTDKRRRVGVRWKEIRQLFDVLDLVKGSELSLVWHCYRNQVGRCPTVANGKEVAEKVCGGIGKKAGHVECVRI